MLYKYDKLVRDKIVENIQKRGHNTSYRVLEDKQYFEELDKKLIEEVNEFIEAHNEEEMADVMEVIETIIKQREMSPEKIEEIKQTKREKAGSFNNKIYLISVEEKDEIKEEKNTKQEER